MSRWLLGVSVFITGFTSVAVEGVAFRALAPFFGTSPNVSSIIVGVVLLGLSAGYYIGGWLARDGKSPLALTHLELAAAAWLMVVAAVHERFLAPMQHYGFLVGSLMGAALLFLAPMVVLSMACPLAIGKITSDRAGTLSGSIYAISTVGSILGIFASTFVLLPVLGVTRSFMACAGLLSILYLASVVLEKTAWQRLLALGVVPACAFLPRPPPPPDLIVEVDSTYGKLRVTHASHDRIAISVNNATEESYNRPRPNVYWQSDYRSFLAFGPAMTGQKATEQRSLAILGMCTGYGAAELAELYAGNIDGVEIDPEIVRLGREYFGLDDVAKGRLNVHVADARRYLLGTTKQYDGIEFDAFRSEFIPYHLTTREYFELVRQRMTSGGVLAINVSYPATQDTKECTNPLFDSIARTVLSAGFPKIFCAPVLSEEEGVLASAMILYAVNGATTLEQVRANLKAYDFPPATKPMSEGMRDYISAVLREVKPPPGELSTDDRSRAEEIMFEGHRNLIGRQ